MSRSKAKIIKVTDLMSRPSINEVVMTRKDIIIILDGLNQLYPEYAKDKESKDYKELNALANYFRSLINNKN